MSSSYIIWDVLSSLLLEACGLVSSPVLPLSSIGNLRESKTRNPIRSLSHDSYLTPDPCRYHLPHLSKAHSFAGSGLKFGQE